MHKRNLSAFTPKVDVNRSTLFPETEPLEEFNEHEEEGDFAMGATT